MSLYLSRLRLRRDPAVAALSALLDPAEQGRARDAHHRLIWSAFAGEADQRRDYLWRAEGQGAFLTLSARAPQPSPFFEPREVKPFAPDLAPGDRLAFALRANATRTRKSGRLTPSGKEHKQHIDLVMDAIHPLPPGRESGDRAAARMGAAQEVATGWLAGQGARAGFAPLEVTAGDYSVSALPGHVGKRRGQPQFGILDLTGVIAVTDPAAFLAQLAQGFGRARAFGCGLMLIRRA